jgi:hypothetical protein
MSQQELETNETRRLLCELTDLEVMEKGIMLKDCLKQLTEFEVEKARITAHMKPVKSQIEDLVPIIDTRKEMREVECDWRYDWPKSVKILYRTDTFEEVDRKPITDAERQIQLELNGQED